MEAQVWARLFMEAKVWAKGFMEAQVWARLFMEAHVWQGCLWKHKSDQDCLLKHKSWQVCLWKTSSSLCLSYYHHPHHTSDVIQGIGKVQYILAPVTMHLPSELNEWEHHKCCVEEHNIQPCEAKNSLPHVYVTETLTTNPYIFLR